MYYSSSPPAMTSEMIVLLPDGSSLIPKNSDFALRTKMTSKRTQEAKRLHNSLSRHRFTLGMPLPLVGGLSLAVLCTGLCRRWRALRCLVAVCFESAWHAAAWQVVTPSWTMTSASVFASLPHWSFTSVRSLGDSDSLAGRWGWRWVIFPLRPLVAGFG